MSQALPIPPPGFDGLSIEEQIEYVEALWEHIVARPHELPVPQWHRDVLAERITQYRSGLEGEKTWEEFEQELAKE